MALILAIILALCPAEAQTLLRLNVSEGRLLHLARPPASLFLADPKIADLATPTRNTIFLYGKAPGRTSLFALDAQGKQLGAWRVVVSVSDAELQQLIRSKIGNYPVSLQITANGATLSGQVPTPQIAERVRALAAQYAGKNAAIVDDLHVTGSLQVQLRVRVAEVSRSVTKELGLNWSAIGQSGSFAIGLLTGRPVAAGTTLAGVTGNLIQPAAPGVGSLFGSYAKAGSNITSVLDALASESLVRELAEPTLVTTSGEQARFLAGGEFPIPVGQGLGQVAIEYKRFGVALDFKPTVVNEDLISMRVSPEVSTLVTTASSGAISANGFSIPALQVRRAETTVELGSGQSFAIGGLLQNNITSQVTRFPGLADIPILGALFRSTSFQRQETELVIIVTPVIVRPVSQPSALRVPTDTLVAPNDVERILRAKLSDAPGGSAALRSLGQARLRGDMGFVVE